MASIISILCVALVASFLCQSCGAISTADATITNEWWNVTVLIADPQAANMTYLSELRIWQPSFNHWSSNLLFNYTQYHPSNISQARHTATSIASNGTWYPATGGVIVSLNKTAVQIDDILIGSYALESWHIAVNGTQLSWRTKRRYLVSVTYDCSRFPTLVLNTQYTAGNSHWRDQAQIPSTLDNSFVWNGTFGFECRMGEVFPAGTGDVGKWSYTYTPNPTTSLLLSPADLSVQSTVISNKAFGGFSMAWPYYPGTGGGDTCMSIGVTSLPGPTPVAAFDEQDVTWSLNALPSVVTEAAPLSV